MKKSLLLPLMALSLFLGALIFNACQKEKNNTVLSGKEGKGSTAQSGTKTCVHPIFYNKVVDASCSDGHPCIISSFPSTTRNRIKWRTGTQCNNTQNFTATAYYTLYKYAAPSGSYQQYNKVATFNCSNPNMWYAKTLLTNSTAFILIVSDLSSALPSSILQDGSGWLYTTGGSVLSSAYYYSDYWSFTTGNGAGAACTISPPPSDN